MCYAGTHLLRNLHFHITITQYFAWNCTFTIMEPVNKDVSMNSFDFSLEMGRHKSHDVGETHELKVIATKRTS